MYYRGAQAAIVVYDITNTVSHAFCNNVNCLNPEVLLDVLCMLIIQVSAVRLRRIFVFSTWLGVVCNEYNNCTVFFNKYSKPEM